MNQLELLNVLDVIKNEDVYNKRLSEVKAAEQKLRDARYIKETLESADRTRTEAEELLEKARKFRDSEETRLKKEAADNAVANEKQRKVATERQAAAAADLKAAKEHVVSVRELKASTDAERIRLEHKYVALLKQEKSIRERETLLKQKIDKINEVMKDG